MLDLTYVGESSKYKIEFKKMSEHIVSVKGNLKANAFGRGIVTGLYCGKISALQSQGSF